MRWVIEIPDLTCLSRPHPRNIRDLIMLVSIIQVEKTRHLLLLREKLGDTNPAPSTKSLSELLSPSMSSGTLSTSTSISSQISSTTFESAITPSESSGYDSTDIESLVDREKELATKVRAETQMAMTHSELLCRHTMTGSLLLIDQSHLCCCSACAS